MTPLTPEEQEEIRTFLKTYKGATTAGRWFRNTIIAVAGVLVAWKVIWEFFK